MRPLKEIIKDPNMRALMNESWNLSWPMTLIMFYEFMIGMTDVYVAGRFGRDVQAGYGLAFQLYFIFIIIGIALSVGTVSVIARLYAQDKNGEGFRDAVGSALSASAMTGLFCSIIGVSFADVIINSFNIPGALGAYSIPLLRIYSCGFIFDYLLLTTNGILRSCGMIKQSLKTMTVVCLMNVVLNFYLALGTPLGASGIAWATVISLLAGAAMNIVSIYRLSKKLVGFSKPLLTKILSISWPAGVHQVIWQLGSAVLFGILARLPEKSIETIAAFTNGLKIESAIFLPAFAFNMANAVIVGNLLGKKDGQNAARGGVVTAVIGVGIVIILTLIIMINAKLIAGFLSNDAVVINESIKYIYIALLSEPFMVWGVILGGGLNGAGDTKTVMLITAVSVWLVRLPLAYLFGIVLGFGAVAVWWAMNISILVQAGLLSFRYFKKGWIPKPVTL